MSELDLEHIARRTVVDDNGCWLWQGALYRDGYACVSLDDKTHQGHRLLYLLLVGDVPDGLVLDHLCRVRHCMAPHHLEPVTPRENLRRGDTPTGWERCQRCGSEFVQMRAQRRCPACHEAYEVSRRPAKAAAERARRAARRATA